MSGSSDGAVRPGVSAGPTSEFSLFFVVKPGHGDALRRCAAGAPEPSGLPAGRVQHGRRVDPRGPVRAVRRRHAAACSRPASTGRGTPTWTTSSPPGRRCSCSTTIVPARRGLRRAARCRGGEGLRPGRPGHRRRVCPELRRHGQGDSEGAAGERAPSSRCSTIRPPATALAASGAGSRCSKRRPTNRQREEAMSDHISGPRALADPIADITDVYAFPSPERPGHLVLVQNTLPFAPATARFSDGLIYRFRLRAVRRGGRRERAVAIRRSRRRGAGVRLRVLGADGRRTAGGHVSHAERRHRRLCRGRRAGRLGARGARLRRGALGSVHHGRPGRAEDDRHRAARVHRPRLDLHGRQERAEHRARDRLREVPAGRRARRASSRRR